MRVVVERLRPFLFSYKTATKNKLFRIPLKLSVVKLYYKSSKFVESKSDKVAYRFWFLFGSHHAYLGKWTNQVLLWLLLLAWLPIVVFPDVHFFTEYLGIFGIGLPALGILWLVADLILIPCYVKKYNESRYNNQSRFKKSEAVDITEETSNFGYPITY